MIAFIPMARLGRRCFESKSKRNHRRIPGVTDHGHEITQVPQLHRRSMPERYALSLQSLFQDRNTSLDWLPWKEGCQQTSLCYPAGIRIPFTWSSAMNKPLPEGISVTRLSHQTAPTQFVVFERVTTRDQATASI